MAATITAFETADWTAITTPKTITVTGAVTGDKIVVLYGGDNGAGGTNVSVATASTGGGSTGTWTEPEEGLATSSQCWISSSTADVTADGTVTVSLARTQSTGKEWGGMALLFHDYGAIGVHTRKAPSAVLTASLTTGAGSAVAMLALDWDDNPVVAFTPAGSTEVERTQGPNIAVYGAYWTAQTAGAHSYGLATNPPTTNLHIIAIEILALGATPNQGRISSNAHPGATPGRGVRFRTDVSQRMSYALPSTGITATVAQATETDTATALGEAKARAVGQAAETDTAAALVGRKAKAASQAAETDTAGAITPVAGHIVGRATETDTATTTARSKALGVARAVETDSGTPVTPRKLRAVQAATETDTATVLVRLKRRTVAQASETDTATATTRRKLRVVGAATETDTAGGIQRPGQVGRATELDTATLPGERKTRSLGQATETGTGGGLVRRIKTAVVNRASELDTATALFRQKLKALLRATETDTATLPGERKTQMVARSIETDAARAVTGGGQVAILGAAQETDTAYPITYRLVTPRPAGAVTTIPDLGITPRPGGTTTPAP